ncbi:hypothetical protein BHE90_015662 [Fusarium euwallaceae]|uniref:Uncharacterized protein n=1 Tax=Fusarium euwallaceae TaxID=1147111 RepID=A0A430L2I2_9HYPO|nr:hypothetical protein BHE90_015662 [Fusarium euwallaceae]
MRVTLPVYPRHKTRSKIVTLRRMHQNTSVPVPKVFAFNDRNDNGMLYWIHKMEYETTQLRNMYKARLKELCPEWAEERPLQNDFYEVVSQCDGLWFSKARRWAEHVEKGESVRFKDV